LKIALSRHPSVRCEAVSGVEADIEADGRGWLHVRYLLLGDTAALAIPRAARAARVAGLWRHTCFEVFFAETGTAAYREFNFSPSSQWAALGFRGYRDGAHDLALNAEPVIETRCTPQRLELSVALRRSDAAPAGHGPLMAGPAAVVETRSGELSYWATVHVGTTPDFHAAQCRTVPVTAY
jgi:hypothetical protein